MTFSSKRDPPQPNPGALTKILLPEGGEVTYQYDAITLNNNIDEDDVFKCNITVPSPSAGSAPLVFHGPDYFVIAWYTQQQSTPKIQIYSYGGHWSEPWIYPDIPGIIGPTGVRVTLNEWFFAIFLRQTSG